MLHVFYVTVKSFFAIVSANEKCTRASVINFDNVLWIQPQDEIADMHEFLSIELFGRTTVNFLEKSSTIRH